MDRLANLVKIEEALPEVFKRSYPVVQPTTEMILALSLLRFHQIDALPIEFKASEKRRLAVFGYSCLSKLLDTEPKDYGNYLKLPARKAALELSTIEKNEDISALLQVFQKTKFGFAWVESEKLGGFAGLRDLLGLYDDGTIQTKLRLADLASPIFSLPKETEVRTVISEMFARRIRRIFVKGGDSIVTDRRIIGHLFSSSRLEAAAKKPKGLLDVSLGELPALTPQIVKDTMTAKKAAKLMSCQAEECLVCEKGIVTPWDLIMKPLARGDLTIK